MSKSPAAAVEDERTDASRSVAADAPAPAAALAAPAQRSHARQRAASSRAVSNFVTRTTCHVPKPATFHTHTDHTLLLTPTDYNIYHIYLYTRRLRPATRRLRPAFRLRPPIQLRLANISLQHSNCATRQYQPQKANTQQERSATKHTAAHTQRYQATPGTHRIIRSRSKRSLRLSPSAPPFPIPRKNGSGTS